MPFGAFVAITIFIFLAILGGLVGIVLEGRRMAAGGGQPGDARHGVSDRRLGDTVRALPRAAVRARRGHDARIQGAARHARGGAVLLCGALDRMADLALGAAHPRRLTGRWPVAGARSRISARCAFRSCSSPRSRRRRSNSRAPSFSLSDALLASIVVLLALIRNRAQLSTGSRSAAPPPGTA